MPLGRLGSDWVLDATDALFGRSLRDAGHLLWAADPALPDVSGRSAAAAAEDALADEPPSMEVSTTVWDISCDVLVAVPSCQALPGAMRPKPALTDELPSMKVTPGMSLGRSTCSVVGCSDVVRRYHRRRCYTGDNAVLHTRYQWVYTCGLWVACKVCCWKSEELGCISRQAARA